MNTTLLQLPEESTYHIIAIHCHCEAHQIAFSLNQHLGLRLKRKKEDLDLTVKKNIAYFPFFHFFDPKKSFDYYLVSSKYTIDFQSNKDNYSLFSEKTSLTTHLLPQHKNVDFFLKIEDDANLIDTKKVIQKLNKVSQIITSYNLNVETLKNKENLIFN